MKSVDNIELDDVKDYYNKYYSPSVSNLVIVGDVSETEILQKLDLKKRLYSKLIKTKVRYSK